MPVTRQRTGSPIKRQRPGLPLDPEGPAVIPDPGPALRQRPGPTVRRQRAVVTFRAEGFHRWAEAPDARNYLRYPHRHLFHVAVALDLRGADREVEFHDLLAVARDGWYQAHATAKGLASCETLAEGVGGHVGRTYPGRELTVEVWEDGEVGAVVEFWAAPAEAPPPEPAEETA